MNILSKCLLLIVLGIPYISKAQDKVEPIVGNKMAIGFNINQFQKDFGFGMNLTSPTFFKALAVRLGGNLQWNEYTPVNKPETTWSPYYNFKLGLLAKGSVIENKITVYSEGGLVTIIPNKDFSSKTYILGGYGLFGFEFWSSSYFNYFVELGGIGTGAQTDKAAFNLIYSNGFLTSVGMRWKL